MELWIRSQDRKRLIKCEEIITIEFTERTECEIWNNTVKLGIYKTKERALEVLDEIEGKITQNECLKTMIPKLNNVKGEEEKIGKLFRKMVYEMPED